MGVGLFMVILFISDLLTVLYLGTISCKLLLSLLLIIVVVINYYYYYFFITIT